MQNLCFKEVENYFATLEDLQHSIHPCSHSLCTRVLVGLPSGLPWTAGSQQAGQVETRIGRRESAWCRGAEGAWSCTGSSPCALDPANGQTQAALGAGPVTSHLMKGGDSGGACRGHAGPGEC